MKLLSTADRTALEALARLATTNPFLPERIEAERAVLGAQAVGTAEVWSLRADDDAERANVELVMQRVEPLAQRLRQRLLEGARADRHELELYENLAWYLLYHRFRLDLASEVLRPQKERRVPCWSAFERQAAHWLQLPGVELPTPGSSAHLFACFFQVRRAFHHVFGSIVGASLPAARLRAAVWQSVFTHDLRRYQRELWRRLADVPTLVTGPTGTGKELVARAIALSSYVPFDARAQRFTGDPAGLFLPLNLAALSPTLVESELFGHKRGAFTGALADHAGYFEVCSPQGAVFLDEIGEVGLGVQVKLLRVLQERRFQRIGDPGERSFAGKVLGATHRDLAAEIEGGRFREDLYWRLCADRIETPSLRAQLDDAPSEIGNLVRHLAAQLAGPVADSLAQEALEWIGRELGPDYAWPGNFRELEQCLRAVLVRREYLPPRARAGPADPAAGLARDVQACCLSESELLARYTTLVHARAGSYVETARRLGIDRRTVRARIDAGLRARLRADGASDAGHDTDDG